MGVISPSLFIVAGFFLACLPFRRFDRSRKFQHVSTADYRSDRIHSTAPFRKRKALADCLRTRTTHTIHTTRHRRQQRQDEMKTRRRGARTKRQTAPGNEALKTNDIVLVKSSRSNSINSGARLACTT